MMYGFVIISGHPIPDSRPDQVIQWCDDMEEAKEVINDLSGETADNYYICEYRSSFERAWKGQ